MNQVTEFTFDRLPANAEELKALPEADLSSPHKAAALTVLALIRYTESTDDGLAMLDFLNGPKDIDNHFKQFLRDRLKGKEHVARSYLDGTSPENDYKVGAPYTIKVVEQANAMAEEGYAKLFMISSGADSPRPIVLRKKDTTWFLWEQFLLPGIRLPKSQEKW